MTFDFDALTLDELRARASAKWRMYPPDVLPAWIAEMDVPLDPGITAVLQRAVAAGDTGYITAASVPPAFVEFAGRTYDWMVEGERVMLSPDVLVALTELLRVVTPTGGPIVINAPVYPPFYRILGELHRPIVNVPLLHESGTWSLDFAGLERAFAAGATGYILCSPHNPVGRVFARDELVRVAELAKRYGVVVLADEIHAPLAMPGVEHVPFLVASEAAGYDACVALWSASKTWNLAGLKCSVIVAGSAPMRERLRALPGDLAYRAGHLGALATVAAFAGGEPWREALRAHLDRNRQRLQTLLAGAIPAIRYQPPQAGFLAWLDCRALGLDAEPYDVFLKRGRVALSRGRDFGDEGTRYVRLNFATTSTILDDVVARMARSLA